MASCGIAVDESWCWWRKCGSSLSIGRLFWRSAREEWNNEWQHSRQTQPCQYGASDQPQRAADFVRTLPYRLHGAKISTYRSARQKALVRETLVDATSEPNWLFARRWSNVVQPMALVYYHCVDAEKWTTTTQSFCWGNPGIPCCI